MEWWMSMSKIMHFQLGMVFMTGLMILAILSTDTSVFRKFEYIFDGIDEVEGLKR